MAEPMKIKNSGKVIVITLLVLSLFSTLVIWHDKQPAVHNSGDVQAMIHTFTLQNHTFEKLVGQIQDQEVKAFYSVGKPGAFDWPRDLKRACYSDPLAARWQFADISSMVSNDLEVIRYRSLIDFLDLLQFAEQKSPGYISKLDFGSHVLIKEDILSISYRSVTAIVFALLGLFAVNLVRPKT